MVYTVEMLLSQLSDQYFIFASQQLSAPTPSILIISVQFLYAISGYNEFSCSGQPPSTKNRLSGSQY